jgi:hypothetical protein
MADSTAQIDSLLTDFLIRYVENEKGSYVPQQRLCNLYQIITGDFKTFNSIKSFGQKLIELGFPTEKRSRSASDPGFYWRHVSKNLVCVCDIKLVNIDELDTKEKKFISDVEDVDVDADSEDIKKDVSKRLSTSDFLKATLLTHLKKQKGSYVPVARLRHLNSCMLKLFGYQDDSSMILDLLASLGWQVEKHRRTEQDSDFHYVGVENPGGLCVVDAKLVQIKDLKNFERKAALLPKSAAEQLPTGLSGSTPDIKTPIPKAKSSSTQSEDDCGTPASKVKATDNKDHKSMISNPKGMWSCEHAESLPANVTYCPNDGKARKFYTFDSATLTAVSKRLAELTESKHHEVFYDFVIEAKENTKWFKLKTCKQNNSTAVQGKSDAKSRIFVLDDDTKGTRISGKFDEICLLFRYLNEYYYFEHANKVDSRTTLEKDIDTLFKYNDNTVSNREVIPAKLRDSVFDDSEGKCYCCGRTITRSQFEVGHILSCKHGGTNDRNNLTAICQECNDNMGPMHLFEHLISKQKVPVTSHADKPYDEFYRFQLMYQLYVSQLGGIQTTLKKLSSEYSDKVTKILGDSKKYPFYHRVELLLKLTKMTQITVSITK